MEHLNDQVFSFAGNLHEHITFLANNYGNVEDPDVIGQMQGAWNNFVKTGQIWATLIGIVIGYMFKSLTSYG
ncbi:MAG: hypothetical protein F6K62_06680 [Sphaerospermopsis sp. SIO1G2]|nr:hypothetical protein [Sphaerospermopsis sp. SIO1G1]NET70658.1 hypothetical protein [Sphaerospermopsis sp. SIO1G2]